MEAAEADLHSGDHPASTATFPPGSIAPLTRIAPIDLAAERTRRRSRIGWLVAVAAVIGVIALGGWNIALRQDLTAAQTYAQGVDQALALATQPGSVTAILASEDGSSSGLAVIGADGTTRIAVRGLAPTSGSQVYTAWAIEGDTAPVALGDFTVGGDGLATATVTSPTSNPGAIIALDPGASARRDRGGRPAGRGRDDARPGRLIARRRRGERSNPRRRPPRPAPSRTCSRARRGPPRSATRHRCRPAGSGRRPRSP